MDAHPLAGDGEHALRPTRLIAALGVLTLCLQGGALAQMTGEPEPAIPSPKDMRLEPDPRSAVGEAVDQGFYILHQRDLLGSAERTMLDREIVGPVVRGIAPDRPYGFIFDVLDLNGDGLEDAVITMKMAGLAPPAGFDGAATMIYVRTGDGWRLALEGGSMVVGIREAEAGRSDVALVGEDTVQVFGWDGARFVPR